MDLIPRVFRRKMWNAIDQRLQRARRLAEQGIPLVELLPTQLSRTQLLSNRDKLLRLLPSDAVVAEIGVALGNFTERILSTARPTRLHLIDAWVEDRYESAGDRVRDRFATQIEAGQIVINRGLSIDALRQFDDDYFDWVYLDTDHSYPTTAVELEICRHKVKPEGIIAGHDFCDGNWVKGLRYGVREAVYEFCVREGYEIVYVTSELRTPSFAIKKMM